MHWIYDSTNMFIKAVWKFNDIYNSYLQCEWHIVAPIRGSYMCVDKNIDPTFYVEQAWQFSLFLIYFIYIFIYVFISISTGCCGWRANVNNPLIFVFFFKCHKIFMRNQTRPVRLTKNGCSVLTWMNNKYHSYTMDTKRIIVVVVSSLFFFSSFPIWLTLSLSLARLTDDLIKLLV